MALQHFTDQDFDKEVLKSDVPVLVDFWAAWCGPCKMLGPIVEQISKDYEGKPIKIGKLNVDENNATAGNYGVMSIPTILIFKDGKPVKQMIGLGTKEDIEESINEVLKK